MYDHRHGELDERLNESHRNLQDIESETNNSYCGKKNYNPSKFLKHRRLCERRKNIGSDQGRQLRHTVRIAAGSASLLVLHSGSAESCLNESRKSFRKDTSQFFCIIDDCFACTIFLFSIRSFGPFWKMWAGRLGENSIPGLDN